MLKKISLPVLVTAMCLLMGVVVGLFFLNQKKVSKSKTVVGNVTSEVSRTDYSLVARKTLDWIDQQRNDDGWYVLEKGCDVNKKTCDTVRDNKEGNKDGLIATWARFNFYQQTKDSNDLKIVKSDIDKFYKKYPDGVDNALWICKITYDMYSSGVFDNETNNKLASICFNSSSKFLSVIPDVDEYQKSFSKLLFQASQTDAAWKTWLGYAFILRHFDNYFGLTSDLLSQYLWTKDETKLELAKKYFESGKKIIDWAGSEAKPNDSCLFDLSALDLYERGGKDEAILDYVKQKYARYESGDVKKYRTVVCGLMYKKLYQVTNDGTFLTGLERNNKVMTTVLLDGDNSYANKIGNYGFFITSNGGISSFYKNVVENGLVVELIRD